MYKIIRISILFPTGDKLTKKVDVTVPDKQGLEDMRNEYKAKYDAQSVNLVFEEIPEEESICRGAPACAPNITDNKTNIIN
ncbi:MAG: hypothetical protein LBJ17_08660 [Dysgonamonadaceae bacterium]|jgi:hypothetical protein|nr:hypothetical protein [Dysgonamonadaceae bacterium]